MKDNLIKIAELHEKLKEFMKPDILNQFVDLLDAFGSENSHDIRYKKFMELNGPDCRYSKMSKEFFLKEQAKDVAKCINDLYHSWSKFYK